MSNKNLVWFNKEGDYLNFEYIEEDRLFRGDILIHENSNDTFKTYGLYTLEKVDSFSFELPGELTTRKFQLFNEFGHNIYGSGIKSINIEKIEPVNDDPGFYSKWIYGKDFESLFPKGSLIKFDDVIFEFTNLNYPYVVVSSKKDAIMIISEMDNSTFNIEFGTLFNDSEQYLNKTISGIDGIGIYDYIDGDYRDNLSDWNEPEFYDLYYLNRKLNVVNSGINDGTYTINKIDFLDNVYVEYMASIDSLDEDSELLIEVTTKTDVPKIYKGGINILETGEIILSRPYPQILKPGQEFKIVGISENDSSIFFRVSESIPRWSAISEETDFKVGDQVVYENIIYQCVTEYTQSFSDPDTLFINPKNSNFWSFPDKIITDRENLVEEIADVSIYLTTDKYYFSLPWTDSKEVTMASAAQKYSMDVSIFNINLYYKEGFIKADLLYPSAYAEVKFYSISDTGLETDITDIKNIYERLVGVSETLNSEKNTDISENFEYTIVFNNIDSSGIRVNVNKMVYDIETEFVFSSGISINMTQTIDKTLRNWLKRNYIALYRLGIDAELVFSGTSSSIFYNSIRLKTHYPNVPISIDDIFAGTTGDYHIEHSNVTIFNLGPYLNIEINGTDYGVESTYFPGTNLVDIDKTILSLYNTYRDELSRLFIEIAIVNSKIFFRLKSPNRRLDYKISTSIVSIPGILDYVIEKNIKGNHGMLIASNEVILPEETETSFLDRGFSTGMVFSINNTIWTFVNQEFNITYLDDNKINLSYQGPFWGLTQSICNSSAFVTLAFDFGFLSGECDPGPIPLGGEYDSDEFNNAYTITFNPNTYDHFYYENYSTDDLVDIKYIELTSRIYGLSDFGIVVVDAANAQKITEVAIDDAEYAIKIEFNNINSYFYLVYKNKIVVFNPITNNIIRDINTNGNDIVDLAINQNNGDAYVTFDDTEEIRIWTTSNITNNTPPHVINGHQFGKIAFHENQGDIYVTTNSNKVIRIDGNNKNILEEINIDGLDNNYIFYEPSVGALYVYSDNLIKIINTTTTDINQISKFDFIDLIYNNITENVNISDSESSFKVLNVGDDDFKSIDIGGHGYMVVNQFDGDVYVSNQEQTDSALPQTNPEIIVTREGRYLYHLDLGVGSYSGKIIYNPKRRSVWTIRDKHFIELGVNIESTIDIIDDIPEDILENRKGENMYGTLDKDYVRRPSIWLKTRDFIRRPRENRVGDVPVRYYWRWLSDDIPEFFLYDFSGDQLVGDDVYNYVGIKPLDKIVLNRKPNKDLNRVGDAAYQQTIFDRINYNLLYVDDPTDLRQMPSSLELFIGFRSQNEGALSSTLTLWKEEKLRIDYISNDMLDFRLTTEILNGKRVGTITIPNTSDELFTGRGLKGGQKVVIYLEDQTNTTNQYTSINNASIFIIEEVYPKIIVFNFISEGDELFTEQTVIRDYPFVGDKTYLKLTIKVLDLQLGEFRVFGQTEEEDERFKIELGNLGKLINPDEVFIFKKYDILEGGIDWIKLNKKRKEMLMMKHLIYPYIGSYKSIINAINYFGYNDLRLNEYYRNINIESKNFSKLFKVEIPDIFDNRQVGWNELDFIKGTFPNSNYEETNLFNLTYRITDKSGNNVLEYTLDEVIIKLQGLKYWLSRNIIPLTHKILDITGEAYFNSVNSITHNLYDIQIYKMTEEMTPITSRLNEAYLMPVNSGSTVYNCVIDFYSIIENIGKGENSLENSNKIKPDPKAKLKMPDYFKVEIETYKTHKEWAPFVSYELGERVVYFDKLYESAINNNRTRNPRKYESAQPWRAGRVYKPGSIVKYKNLFYAYKLTTETISNIPPVVDATIWEDITEWKVVNYKPVQRIIENRQGDDLSPLNFTVDSNIDPFIVINVISDNGYGQIYNDIKTYEIRGLLDLIDGRGRADRIGPFVPIQDIT
jgi:hypothetical protein